MNMLTRQTLRIFWEHARQYGWLIAVILLGTAVGTGLDLYKPFLYKALLDGLAVRSPHVYEDSIHVIYLVLIVQCIGWVGWRLATFSDSFLASRVMSNLLNTCYTYLIGHSYDFFTNNFSGSLVRRVNRYTKSYEQISDQIFWNLGRTFFVLLTILIVLFIRSWIVGLIVVVWGIFYLIVNAQFTKYKWQLDIKYSEVDSRSTGHLADGIANVITIKLFGGAKYEIKAFKKLTERLFQLRHQLWNLDSLSEAVQSSFMVVLEFVVMYAAIYYWQRDLLTLGDIALIQAYLIKVFDRLWDIGKNVRKIYSALSEANEMTEMLIKPHDIQDKPGAGQLRVTDGAINFNHVNFGYHAGKSVYKDFNLAIKSGERVALIGPSGGGKSTIVKLLFRFFDIRSGEILIDGQNIADVTQESLRAGLALVPQEPILFHRSLMENIRYARPSATDAEVIAAAKLAHCHEFIGNFPDKYKTLVGERGVKLSGGERQRVAIARAILKNSPILVLDEATSSLDSESEQFIQDALKNLMKDRTTIVIAHRLSTIMQMDRIMVIEKGKIKEDGTHSQLLKIEEGTYQKLWGIQAGGFKKRSI